MRGNESGRDGIEVGRIRKRLEKGVGLRLEKRLEKGVVLRLEKKLEKGLVLRLEKRVKEKGRLNVDVPKGI